MLRKWEALLLAWCPDWAVYVGGSKCYGKGLQGGRVSRELINNSYHEFAGWVITFSYEGLGRRVSGSLVGINSSFTMLY